MRALNETDDALRQRFDTFGSATAQGRQLRTAPINETDLIQRARFQDEAAFAALVEAFAPAVYRIVRRMVIDTLEAESIVQETFWRFWQKLPSYKTSAPLLPYLATIASNLARDHYRREKWIEDRDIEEDLDSGLESDSNVEADFDQDRILEQLTAAVESLPPGYRAVISLRYDAGMSYAEIAGALSLPLNTVRTHLRRAKGLLRERLAADTAYPRDLRDGGWSEEADHG